MEEGKFKIYTLDDDKDREVRYVGQTINPANRYRDHIMLNTYGAQAKDDWIKDRVAQGITIEMNIIDSTDTKEEANKLERYWICHYHLAGARLFNSEVYHAASRNDPKLITRLLAHASSVKNRPSLTHLVVIGEEDIAGESLSISPVDETSLSEAKRLVDKVIQGLRNGYDAEICAIALEQVSKILTAI